MVDRNVFTIDVGGTAVKYGLVSVKAGEPHITTEGSVPMDCTSREAFFQLLKSLYVKYGKGASGIGLSIPGIVDMNREVNVSCGALEKFLEVGCPTAKLLSDLCGVPVHLINDAKAAALAESKFGVLKDCNIGAVVIIGNGVGGALVINGKVLNGAHFSAGEFSRVFADIHKQGDEGLWYKYGSCHRLCREASGKKATDETTGELSGQEVFRLVRAGNLQAKEALDSYVKDMAAMLQSVQMFYDPERIAIGGGLSRDKLLIDALREKIERVHVETYGEGFPKPEIEVCRYSGSANLIGAYANYIDREY